MTFLSRYRRAPLVAGLALAAVALTACSSSGASTDAVVSSKPASGGTLKVQLSATPSCIDPGVGFSANERAVVRPLVDSLVDMDPKTGKIVPWLASSWEVNDDATSYTFHIKKGVTFSDGTTLDANAVKSSFDFVSGTLKATSTRGAGYLRTYTGTKVIDPLTAEVDFSAPAVNFLPGASTTTLGIVSVASASKTPAARCTGDFIGSGPFTLSGYTQGQSATVVKRKGYDWSSTLASHKGDAYLDGIDFQVVNVSNARDGALESKQADVGLDIATQDVAQLKAAGVTPLFATQPGMPTSLLLNDTRAGLDDQSVRTAIQIGFDRASAVKAVLGDYYSPADSALTSNLPQYKSEAKLTAFSATKAKAALKAAGWLPGAGGVREKDGVKLAFTVTYTSTFGAYYTNLLQLFQQQMKDIGIQITLNDGTQSAQVALAFAHDFDMYITSLTDVDPDVVRSVAGALLTKQSLVDSGVADLFTETQSESVPAERTATYGKIQDALVGKALIVPFWEGGQFIGYGSNVKDVKTDFQGWLNLYDTNLTK